MLNEEHSGVQKQKKIKKEYSTYLRANNKITSLGINMPNEEYSTYLACMLPKTSDFFVHQRLVVIHTCARA